MVTKELLDYLKQMLSQGVSEENVKKILIDTGWDPKDVNEAFVSLKYGVAQQSGQPQSIGSSVPQNNDFQPQSGNKKRFIPLVVVIVTILVVLGGGLGFAYTKKFWPFSSYFGAAPKQETTVGDIFDRFSKINSASYTLTLGIESRDRDPDAQPIVLQFPEFEAQQPLYDRDAKQFKFIDDWRYQAQRFFNLKKKYPQSIAEVNPDFKDPSGAPYGYEVTADGSDFKLTIIFETPEAIEALQSRYAAGDKRPTIGGKTAVFTKASVETYYYFTPSPKRPAFVEFFSDQENLFAFLPGNMKAAVNVGGTTQKESNALDGRFQAGADIQFEDFIINADIEILKKGDIFYGRINKFPGLFIDISKIKGKWVKTTLADLVGAGYGAPPGFDLFLEKGDRDKSNLALQQFQLFFRIAQEESAIAITKDNKTEESDSQKLYHYHLALNKEKLPAFYKRLTDEFAKQFGNKSFIKFDERTLSYLQAPSFDGLFNYLSKNSSFDIWTDEKTGYPVKFFYSFRLVPSDKVSKLKNKQVNLAATFALNDVNKPVAIDAPKDAISFEDAQIQLTGKSKEEYLISKQKGGVQALQRALNVYRDLAGSYPDILEELKITGTDAKKLNKGKPTGEIYDPPYGTKYPYGDAYEDKLILEAVPNDAITGKPYEYKKNSDDFTLGYVIKLPPYVPGTYPADIIKVDSQTSCDSPPCFMMYLKFVDGKNTATSKTLSLEAVQQSKIDSDRDSTSDSLEIYIGTNKNKVDTDGDGTPDGKEFSYHTNPLGPGNLEGPYY